MRVRVFRNLTRRCLSIQGKTAKGWRTVAHAEWVTLDAVAFRVSEAGRQRVLKTGRKVVHAYAEGDLREWNGWARLGVWSSRDREALEAKYRRLNAFDSHPAPLPIGITYNPTRAATFTTRSGEPVVFAESCTLSTAHGVTAYAPRGPIAPEA